MWLRQSFLSNHGRVAYHDSEGFANDVDERDRLVNDLGDRPVMTLRNQGTLVVGRTIGQAFSMMWHLEMAMQTQVDALASGRALTVPGNALAEKIAANGFNEPGVVRANGTVSPLGHAEWPALLRMLDRIDTSYRH